jgi:hypothetical protein
MIAKTIRGTGFKGALDYVFNDKNDNHHDRATLLATNCAGNDASSISGEMRAFANTNNRIGYPVHHIILSHNKDNLTNDQWCELADKYIEKMGYQNHQYALIRHNDTNDDHCHLIINSVNMENSKGYNSSHEKLKSLKAIKEITQEMNLTPNTAQQAKHLDHGNRNMKAIQDAIDTVLSTNKGIKPDEFEKQLKNLGVTAKRAENVNGIQGYSFKVDGSTEAFTGKRLGSDYKLAGLEARGLLTPRLDVQQAQQVKSIMVELLVAEQKEPKSQYVTPVLAHTTYSKQPEIGISEQQKFEEEQRARKMANTAKRQDFDAMQSQWAADKVRLNAENRSRRSHSIAE